MNLKLMLPLALVPCITTNSFATTEMDDDLFGLDLTQLMNIRVESATKRPQTLADTAAAIYVISSDEIRRSAATTLPEVLHLAPGVEVARINGSTWAVTVRGYQSQFANKLLVLIDGRSVYTPLYSGVYWDSQMPMMDDIDRIEVIRGPGSSLWGSNAVHGVINIITKHSADTQGHLLTAGAGDVEKGYARYRGGHEFDSGAFRYYAQYRKQDESIDAVTGEDARDDYETLSAGFRTDWQSANQDRFTLQGDYMEADKNNNISLHPYVEQQVPNVREDIGSENANMLFRWQHPYAGGNSHVLQTYVDWADRNESTYRYERTTIDIDYQFNHLKNNWHQLTWGFSYRWITDDYEGTYAFDLLEDELEYDQATAFIQDEFFITDNLTAILGVKLENTEFTDFEYQPTARILWNSSDELTLWGAVSRAIRTPSRGGRSILIHGQIPESIQNAAKLAIQDAYGFPPSVGTVFGELAGSEDFTEETMIAYETGARYQITPDLFIDAAAYYHDYSHLRTFELDIENPVSPVETDFATYYVATANFYYDNEAEGHAEGFELAANWNVLNSWQMKLSYTYQNFIAESYDSGSATGASEFADQSPQNQAMLRSWHELGPNWELDWTLKYYDELPDNQIEEYTDMDIRVGYLAHPQLDIALVGKNLFDSPRVEFEDTIQGPYRTEMRRSVYLQFTWRSE